MAPTAPRLLVIDPLSLMGREILLLLERDLQLPGALSYYHTADDDEHQIAELAGQPALVPPLESVSEIADYDGILVASDATSARLDSLLGLVDDRPDTPLVDISRCDLLREVTEPAVGARHSWGSVHVRVAHPSLVAFSILLDAVGHLGPLGGSVAAVEPASSLGVAAVESLARQAGQRIQGAPVEELINESVLAFNLVVSDNEDLDQDAATLFPDLDLAVTRSLAGHFHGHVAHICLHFPEPIEEYELHEALSSDTRIVAHEPPFALDATPETDQVTVLRPRLSRNRRCLATTALFDGLRIGGALTALEILQSILEPPS